MGQHTLGSLAIESTLQMTTLLVALLSTLTLSIASIEHEMKTLLSSYQTLGHNTLSCPSSYIKLLFIYIYIYTHNVFVNLLGTTPPQNLQLFFMPRPITTKKVGPDDHSKRIDAIPWTMVSVLLTPPVEQQSHTSHACSLP